MWRPGIWGSTRSRRGNWQGGEPDRNAEVIRAVLAGRDRGAARTAVLINAAAAYYVAGGSESLEEGVAAAARAIDSGGAAAVLERLIEASQRAA